MPKKKLSDETEVTQPGETQVVAAEQQYWVPDYQMLVTATSLEEAGEIAKAIAEQDQPKQDSNE